MAASAFSLSALTPHPSTHNPCRLPDSLQFLSGAQLDLSGARLSSQSDPLHHLPERAVFVRSAFTNNDQPAEDDRWINSSSRGREQQMRDNCTQYVDIRTTEQTGDAEIATALSTQDLVHDWRGFRARLCRSHSKSNAIQSETPHTDAQYWAHRIPILEKGCVLVATEKLDNHPLLSKAVVLLLNCDAGSVRGVILNRKLPFALEDVNNVDTGVALGLAACPMFLGGSLDTTSSFHLLSSNTSLRGFDPILPGLCAGGEAALFTAMNSIRRRQVAAKELRVHVGEMEWDMRGLKAEVGVFEWWTTVACSSSLLLDEDVKNLWERIHSVVSMSSR